jgi:hypothetical protein
MVFWGGLEKNVKKVSSGFWTLFEHSIVDESFKAQASQWLEEVGSAFFVAYPRKISLSMCSLLVKGINFFSLTHASDYFPFFQFQ